MIDPLLLTTVRINTFKGTLGLTTASGFFFDREGRLYLITSRHVFEDAETNHHPDRIEIEIHIDASDLGRSTGFSIPLFTRGKQGWRDSHDADGSIDVAAIEVNQWALPSPTLYRAFTPDHLQKPSDPVAIGSTLLAVGYPLGFEDTLHHLPVARQASLASSFGLRFKGKGYFLIDARTHRGLSGAPVVQRQPDGPGPDDLPWRLLGVHSARLESSTRDPELDEALGLNAIWYSDVITALTEGPSA